jgi:ubiquinone biosynthesis accessory factor UbiJ
LSRTLDFLLQSPWARLANRVLRDHPLAQERLKRFAGKIARFRSGPFDLPLLVGPDGGVEVAPASADVDVTIDIPPALLPRLASHDEAAMKSVGFEGDAEFAQEISYLVRNLKWDVEEDLSRVTGDIVAHRIVSGARDLHAWSREARERLGANVQEYLTEERPALVPRRDAEAFVRDVDTLRDDAARLEKRIELLKRTK